MTTQKTLWQSLPRHLRWQACIVDWLGRRTLKAFAARHFVRGCAWRALYVPWSHIHMKQHVRWYRQVSDELQAVNARNN